VRTLLIATFALLLACGGAISREEDGPAETTASKADLRALVQFPNENGMAATLNVNGTIDTTSDNPFFRSMGTNGRSCASCHVPRENFHDGSQRRSQRSSTSTIHASGSA
jgi:cytochrome c peroxidase